MFEFLTRWFGRRRTETKDPPALARFQQLQERSAPPSDRRNGRADLLTRVREHEVETNMLVRPRIPTGAEWEAGSSPANGPDLMKEVKRANRDISGRKGF